MRILGYEPQGPGEMAELIGISPQAATKMADSLERRGYVERKDDDADRRRVVLHLTDLGRRYERAIIEVVDASTSRFARASRPPTSKRPSECCTSRPARHWPMRASNRRSDPT